MDTESQNMRLRTPTVIQCTKAGTIARVIAPKGIFEEQLRLACMVSGCFIHSSDPTRRFAMLLGGLDDELRHSRRDGSAVQEDFTEGIEPPTCNSVLKVWESHL